MDRGGERDDGSNTGSGISLNSNGCRMSSGGSGSTRSSSGGPREEELDAISTWISAGDPQTSVESGGELPQEPAFNNSANLPVDTINNSFGRADDMAGSGVTGTEGEITFAEDNQETSLVLANQQLSSWQGLGGQAAAAAAAADSSLGDHSSVVQNTGASSSRGATDNNCNGNNGCPPHGIVSLCGRRREMEDAVVAKPTFMELACDVVGGCNGSRSSQAAISTSQIPLHFFGVYDGHGGSQVTGIQ